MDGSYSCLLLHIMHVKSIIVCEFNMIRIYVCFKVQFIIALYYSVELSLFLYFSGLNLTHLYTILSVPV